MNKEKIFIISMLVVISALLFALGLVAKRDKKLLEMHNDNFIECIEQVPNPEWCFDKFIKVTQ